MDKNLNSLFSKAIPGESMTSEFGTHGFQRPSEYSDPVDALEWHLDRLQENKTKVVDALELGIPVKDLNLGMLRGAVANSMHDMDTMFILAPVTHEAIEMIAEKNGMKDFKSGFEEDLEGTMQIQRMKMQHKAKNMDPMAPIEEAPMVPEEATMEEAVAPQGKGLMSRPVEGAV